MARVAVLSDDLMFGSRVCEMLSAAGHDVALVTDEREAAGAADVLVVDLTDAAFSGIERVRGLAADGSLGATRTLGFFAHVEPDVRERALAAGFDQVVPRSRMAREGAELVDRLIGG